MTIAAGESFSTNALAALTPDGLKAPADSPALGVVRRPCFPASPQGSCEIRAVSAATPTKGG